MSSKYGKIQIQVKQFQLKCTTKYNKINPELKIENINKTFKKSFSNLFFVYLENTTEPNNFPLAVFHPAPITIASTISVFL